MADSNGHLVPIFIIYADGVFSIVEEISGNFEEILESKITEEEMDAYAQWKYHK